MRNWLKRAIPIISALLLSSTLVLAGCSGTSKTTTTPATRIVKDKDGNAIEIPYNVERVAPQIGAMAHMTALLGYSDKIVCAADANLNDTFRKIFPGYVKANPKGLSTSNVEDVIASKDHDFRRDWEVTLASYRKLGLKLKDLKRHEVTLAEVGKAVSIASALKDDKEAVDYFIALATQMTTDKQFCIELGFIPEEFRGYVWSLKYQVIANAAAFAEYRLGSIIGRPLTRYIYF